MGKLTKKILARDLKVGQRIEEIFLVSRAGLAETKAGKPYLRLTLADKSGEIRAILWERAEDLAPRAPEGGFVLVAALVDDYQGQKQLKVDRLAAVPLNEVDEADFVAVSRRDAAEMRAELAGRIAGIRDAGLRGLLEALFRGETLERFCNAPAAKSLHHACRCGLLEHSLSVAAMAEFAAGHYPELNRDLLVAGALVHDLAKIDDYEWNGPAIGHTTRGRLLGHLVLGVERVLAAAREAKTDAETADLLAHLIASHHGKPEFGAPTLPMTPEAVILHRLDDIDAKMNAVGTLQAALEDDDCHWTDRQYMFDTALYLRRPAAATPEAQTAICAAIPETPEPQRQTPHKFRHLRRLGKAPGSPRLPQPLREQLQARHDALCGCGHHGEEQGDAAPSKKAAKQESDQQLALF